MEVSNNYAASLLYAENAAAQKTDARGTSAKTKAGEKKEAASTFKSLNELTGYLRDTYEVVRNGQTAVSSRHLRDCLTDEDKRKMLFENLAVADATARDAAKNRKGLQSFRIRIDEDGEMTMESSRRTVTFNAAKRARQIAAAKSAGDIKTVMGLLSVDLSQCEDGLRDGACDEAEVEKVKAMIREAERRMAELSGKEASPGDEVAFSVSLLI